MDDLYIKYETTGSFDLGLIGESFSGLNSILKDLSEMTGINGEIDIQTSKIEFGSIEVFNAIQITITALPFTSPQDLLNFLQVASPEMYKEACHYLSGGLNVRRDLNDYFADHAFDAIVIVELTKSFITNSWKWAAKQRNHITTKDAQLGDISKANANKLRTMVSSGKFRKVLKPLTEGNIHSLSVKTSQHSPRSSVTVGAQDIENYLPDKDQILPEFINGTTHFLTGELRNLQSAHGEIIKIRLDGAAKQYSLITAKPHDGQTTEDYLPFYHKQIAFEAEVVRASMYKRPDFVIKSMSINQLEMLPEPETIDYA